MLQLIDVVKINAVKEDPGRVKTSEAFPHDSVDGLVVGNGGFPAHSSEEPDCLHVLPPATASYL
jgi:hypothetical protein